MSQQLVLRREDSEGALLSVLKALEIERTLGAEPVLAALRRFPAQEARHADFPDDLDPRLRDVLGRRGVERPYTHQREAYDAARAGRDAVVVTPTASGKTLCYNLPVLDTILKDPDARALYLFPTKALAQDQLAELYGLIETLGADIGTFTYDGDTPQDARKAIRARAHIVVTNPDMLHKGILPHHTKWVKLFENLRYVIVDELHTHRGVYGSHVANIFRRLRRLCEFYGSRPQFLCSSATIGNPKELAEALTGREMTLIDQSGAPRGERYFALYNPPVVNRQLGIRRSALGCARDVALSFLKKGLQTIVFAPSRLSTEVLVTYLKDALETRPGSEGVIRGYRGGYLPLKRREIERGLRDGSVLGVVSTNALELGIDIGSLDAAVLLGYPGSVASAWQQAGRAGRRQGSSVAVLVANSTPLNQFIAKHPDYFFDAPVEQARINAENLHILVSHIKCAAFELPFTAGESFGRESLEEILGYLEEERLVHRAGDRWHWTSESYPADAVSLRSVSSDNFVVQDITREPRIVAEVDFDSAPSTLHEKAVYILEGRTFFVEKYDHEERRAHVREAEVDYYTDAITYTKVKILDRFAEEPAQQARRSHGEVHVTSQVVGFKKIKFYTNENVGSGELQMPENEMHTTAYWLTLPRELMASLPYSGEERRDGVVALAYTLGQLAALFLMCDRHDIGVALGDNGQGEAVQTRGLRTASTALTERPWPGDDYEPQPRSSAVAAVQIFVYDNYPGGIGLSEPLYRLHGRLVRESEALIAACACSDGCPSCVGTGGRDEQPRERGRARHPAGGARRGRVRQEGSDPHRPMSRASTRVPCGLLSILLGGAPAFAAALPPVRAVVLGIAQDGGVPHIGCTQPLCVRARRDPSRRERVACLGLIDDRAGARFLIDATPDLPSQLDSLNQGRALADPRRPVDGILLTHAHIGHYTGLMYLGREALGARAVPVYATARMASLLRTSGPWSQLVALGQIELREVEPGREVVLTPSLAVTPVRVPHRDELSDTVGYVVRGPGQALLYIPDIDKWEKWDRRIEDEVAKGGIALLDGTFFSADELPGRSITEVPHPTVGETTARLAALSSRVSFIHLNHTNPLLWDGRARHDLARRGFALAADGRVFSLEGGR